LLREFASEEFLSSRCLAMNYSGFQASCHIIYNPKKNYRIRMQNNFDNNCIKEPQLSLETFVHRFGSPFTNKSSPDVNIHIVPGVTRSVFIHFLSIYEDNVKHKIYVLGRQSLSLWMKSLICSLKAVSRFFILF
jgi:5-methylcytosine-specific restriction endonuclease McrBC GTP-binding regulatory subunit McrB